jgi:membrane dipeptidase
MIEQMNRVGMIIDVSHVSDSTLFDVVSITNAPVIASHSSVRALADVPRNLSDDGIRAIASTGGVVLINFFDRMLNPALNGEVAAAIYARVDSLYQGDLRDYWAASAGVYADYGLRPSSVADLAAHIDYVAQLVGPEHVGLGSDFDGMSSLPAGLHDVTRLPWITYELVRLGYTDEDIFNILGGNVLRVMERVEEAARRSG